MESTARPRSTGRFLVLAAAMLALAVLSQQSWAAGFRGTAKSALAPIEAQMMSLATAAEHATAVFGDIASLRDQNELRKALDFQRSFGHRTVVAQVVGRGPDAFSRTLQIDRGSDDGLQAGMVVVSGAGLIGRVSERGPHGAIVQTLAEPQSRANVFLSGSGLQGTVIGGPGDLQVQIEHRLGAAASK